MRQVISISYQRGIVEGIVCSKRSDSGERCEVKKAMKSRGDWGERCGFPLSPLPLPRFYFFALLFTSHSSPLSERLEQAMEGSARMPGVSSFSNRTPIVRLTSIEFGNRLRARGVLPYITYVAMCHPIGYGVAPFWSENGYRFCPF